MTYGATSGFFANFWAIYLSSNLDCNLLNYQYVVIIYSQLQDTTQPNNEVQVGLNAKHWHEQDATIPFKLTFSMPPLDKRTRGYTPQYIKELQESVGGIWG